MCVRSSGVTILAWILLSHLTTASLAADHVSEYLTSAQTIQKLRELGVRIEADSRGGDLHRLARELGARIEIDPEGNVVDLRLRGPWVKDDTLKRIGQLSTLQRLCLGRSSTTDAGLQHLKHLSQLKRLGLWRTQVTDKGMKCVAELAELEKLDLSLTTVGDQGLGHLKRLKNLRWLRLQHNRGMITACGLQHLASMPNLRYLDLRTTEQRFPEGGFAALRGCRLERLCFDRNVREDEIEDLAGLTQLKWLPSLSMSITPDILRRLKSLKQLQELTISTLFLASERAEVILEFPNLRSVYVCRVEGGKFSDRESSILGKLPKLESLNLRELAFSGESLAGLTDTPSLRELNLRDTGFSDAGAVHLGRIATLRVLQLGNTRLTDAGLAHIGRLTDLESLDVSGTKVTEKGLEHLKGMTKLTWFYPTHSISYDTAKAFQQYVPNCRIGDAWCCGCFEIEPLAERQLRRGKSSVQE